MNTIEVFAFSALALVSWTYTITLIASMLREDDEE